VIIIAQAKTNSKAIKQRWKISLPGATLINRGTSPKI